MENFNTTLLVAAVVIILGICCMISAIRMKKTGKISSLIASEDELKKCKKKKELIEELYMPFCGMGLICVAFGLFSIVDQCLYAFPVVIKLFTTLIFVCTCVTVVSRQRKAREKYLSL
ncbi:MAG: hypothetical protein ACI4DO_01195 [Roseburia sp.]